MTTTATPLISLTDHIAVHEALHVVVALRFGLRVRAVIIAAKGAGRTLVGFPVDDPDGMYRAAVAAAVGPVYVAAAGGSDDGCADDREAVRRLAVRFQHITGRPMPEPWGDARELLRDPEISRQAVALARYLIPGTAIGSMAIEQLYAGLASAPRVEG